MTENVCLPTITKFDGNLGIQFVVIILMVLLLSTRTSKMKTVLAIVKRFCKSQTDTVFRVLSDKIRIYLMKL